MTKPDFCIVGAPKSGTSSLFNWLSDHPQLVPSKTKQPHYFDDEGTHQYDENNNFLTGGVEGYKKFFPEKELGGSDLVFEATPNYFFSDNAITNLKKVNPNLKIVIVLREPSEQIYSLFQYFKNNWQFLDADMGFSTFVERVEAGIDSDNDMVVNCIEYARYINYVLRWREMYGADNVYVCLFESMKEDEREFLDRLCEFLGVDTAVYDNYEFDVANATYKVNSNFLQKINVAIRSYIPRGKIYEALRSFYWNINTSSKEELSGIESESRLKLAKKYQQDNQRLSEVCNLDLSLWG